jgi:limonene-1,2-epoxide hydrolase
MAKYIVTKGTFQGHAFKGEIGHNGTRVIDLGTIGRSYQKEVCVRVLNDVEVLECAMFFLDICRPSTDRTQDYAERMDMVYLEDSEEWIDMEGIFESVRKNMLFDPFKTKP